MMINYGNFTNSVIHASLTVPYLEPECEDEREDDHFEWLQDEDTDKEEQQHCQKPHCALYVSKHNTQDNQQTCTNCYQHEGEDPETHWYISTNISVCRT